MPLTFDLEGRTLTLAAEPKPIQLPPKLDLELYTVEKEQIERQGRCRPLLSRRQLDRGPRDDRAGRSQVRGGHRLAHRPRPHHAAGELTMSARAARGFTLLEILVAFVVLAAAAGVLYRTFSAGLTSVDMVGGYSDAIAVAEAKLGALGLEKPLIVGEDAGTTEDQRFEWHVTLQDYTPPGPAGTGDGVLSTPVKLLKATVTVSWDQRGTSKRSIELSTVRNVGMNNP